MPQLLCTVRTCHLPLRRDTRRVVCERGHAFDVARSGYVNLLQPQDRRAAVPGDSAGAVAARRRFLDRDFAAPLLEAIRALVAGDTILDAGCGEGYYLGKCRDGLQPVQCGLKPAPTCCGVDISTAAIDLAAKRYPQCEWVVANADRFIPYEDKSFDTVMSITGRMNASEFARVIKPDGQLIVAVPAPDDLIELRGSRNRDRVPRTIAEFGAFKLIDQRRVTTRADLDASAARDILAATYRPRNAEASSVTLSLDVLTFSPPMIRLN